MHHGRRVGTLPSSTTDRPANPMLEAAERRRKENQQQKEENNDNASWTRPSLVIACLAVLVKLESVKRQL